jgi:hypothetical protein
MMSVRDALPVLSFTLNTDNTAANAFFFRDDLLFREP